MPRKNGTMTTTEQKKALTRIDAEIASVVAAITLLESRLELLDSVAETINGLYDVETALHAERRRVWLNTSPETLDRMARNVD